MTESKEKEVQTPGCGAPGASGEAAQCPSEISGPEDLDPNFAMGGQAVIEGVMMRGPKSYAVAVRKPQGDIVMLSRPFLPITKKKKWLGLPVFRGAVSLIEMLVLGYRTLDFSAKVAEQGFLEQEAEEKAAAEEKTDAPSSSPRQPSAAEAIGSAPVLGLTADVSETPPPPAKPEETSEGASEAPDQAEPEESAPEIPESSLGGWQMAGIFAISMGLGMLLFVALPNYTTLLLGKLRASGELVEIHEPILYNLIAGGVRVLVIVGYIWAISFLKDIRRLFQYHGAEHKVVMAFEKKIPLDLEHLRPVTTLHPRCGTTFIAIVILVSIFFFALLAALIVLVFPVFAEWSLWVRKPILILTHILFMPLVGGIAYEITRVAGRKPDYWLYRPLLAPGFLFQRLTTSEPDDSMLEVALASFREALNPRLISEKT